MLNQDQIDFFHENGFLHIPEVFSPEEMDGLDRDHTYLTKSWSSDEAGWSGPWRKVYMDAETEKKSKLIAMHDLQLYSGDWMRAVTKASLVDAVSGLIGPHVELHHTTMHSKPPQTGHPFPMHQDWAFYQHENNKYVDVLVHLDDTCHENGEIRFMRGSHKQGALEHVTMTPEGSCTPHLPTDQYKLEDTVAVPAKRGDVVCFNIHTIHGSYINQTSKTRRLVRLGYRDPENTQTGGQSLGRPGLMVKGMRFNNTGTEAFSTELGAAALTQ